MITSSQKELFEKKLLIEKERVLMHIKELDKELDFGEETTGVHDLDAEADASEEVSNQVSVRDLLRKELIRIESALTKIHSDGYGICEKCKKEISFELLEIDPESLLCKDCKKKGIK